MPDVNLYNRLGETVTYPNVNSLSVESPNGGEVLFLYEGNYYTKTEMDALLAQKQETLVSGQNIKTINGVSILGAGDITIAGGDGRLYIVDYSSPNYSTALTHYNSGDAVIVKYITSEHEYWLIANYFDDNTLYFFVMQGSPEISVSATDGLLYDQLVLGLDSSNQWEEWENEDSFDIVEQSITASSSATKLASAKAVADSCLLLGAQTLTDAQKQQVLTNLGLASPQGVLF